MASIQEKFKTARQYVEFALQMHKNAHIHGGRKVDTTDYKSMLLWCEDLKTQGYPEATCYKLISDFPEQFTRFIKGDYSKNEKYVTKFLKNYATGTNNR